MNSSVAPVAEMVMLMTIMTTGYSNFSSDAVAIHEAS